MDPNRIRRWFRAYPFRHGRAELKRALAMLIPKGPMPPIEILPGLRMDLGSYERKKRLYWWFEEAASALHFLICHYLPVGGRFVDVGAEVGTMGFLAARLKSAKVVAIEPVADNCRLIRSTLTANPAWAADYTLHEAACSPNADPRFSADGTFVRLDDVLARHAWPQVDLLKIDTDGHDLEVIDSLGDWLDPKRVHAIHIEHDGTNVAFFERMRRAGYEAFGVRGSHMHALLQQGFNRIESYFFAAVDAPMTTATYPDFLWVDAASPLAAHLKRYGGSPS
jgi:hypothetical protein